MSGEILKDTQPDPVSLNLQLRQLYEQLPLNKLKRGELKPEDLGLAGNLDIQLNPKWAEAEGINEQDLIDDVVIALADSIERDRRAKSEIRSRLLDILDQKLIPFSKASEPCNWYIRYTISELSVDGVDEKTADRLWFLAESDKAGIFSLNPLEVSEIEEKGSHRIREQIQSIEGLHIFSKVDDELKDLNITSLELASQYDQWAPAYKQKYGKSLV